MSIFSRKQKPEKLPAVVVDRQNTTLPQDATDSLVIAMWLKQRPRNTQDAYRRDIEALNTFTGHTPLKAINLLQLQDFVESMGDQAQSTIARRVSAVKSLLTFAHKAGYTSFNVGAALRSPKVESKLAERIMSEASMQRIMALETSPRNHALLRLLYNAGLRVSEIVALTWSDLQDRGEQGGQIRAYGKGEKERYILISAETYQELLAIKSPKMSDTSPIFQSRKTANGGRLTRGQVNRIVEAAAVRAGVATFEQTNSRGQLVTRSRVSPHWIRHAHASHSLEKGAPMPVVRDTLGHRNISTTNKYAHARPGTSSGAYLAV